MFVIKVQNSAGEMVNHELGGKFASLQHAQGAVETLKLVGETRTLEIVRRGRPAHDEKIPSRPAMKAVLPELPKAATAPTLVPALPKVKPTQATPVPPAPKEISLTLEQVQAIVGAIVPNKKKSGEYLLNLGALAKTAKTG